jgi:hypothetical protein
MNECINERERHTHRETEREDGSMNHPINELMTETENRVNQQSLLAEIEIEGRAKARQGINEWHNKNIKRR